MYIDGGRPVKCSSIFCESSRPAEERRGGRGERADKGEEVGDS